MTVEIKNKEGQQILETAEALSKIKIAGVALAEFNNTTTNPWTDALKAKNRVFTYDEFTKINSLCRFFYRTEPVVSTTVNKLVEIGINGLVFSKNGLSDNEFRLFTALTPKLLDFSEQMAQEFLLSGLVVPEVGYSKNDDKDFIFSLGVKKYSSLTLPDSMFLRDPSTIKIETNWLGDKPAYFVKIPENVIKFIKTGGKLSDGSVDKDMFDKVKKEFPELVKAVQAGKKEMPFENKNIIRRKYTADNPYPISYIAPSLDALQHKRKLRRVDYNIMDKVLSAILHVKVGDKDFPITQTPEDQLYLAQLREQLRMRGNNDQLLERVFQLLTNHTVELKWVFPDTVVLLNEKKYDDINQEILFGLGFPRVLITGETARSGTSDPELATLSPVKTMENFRRKIIEVIRNICTEVSMQNGFKSSPNVEFSQLNLHAFADFMAGISKLYDASALSRTDLARVYGYDFIDQLDKLQKENDELTSRGLPTVGPNPFGSPQNNQGGGNNTTNNPDTKKKSGKVAQNDTQNQ